MRNLPQLAFRERAWSMLMRDVLLQIDSYPEATSDEAMEQAARFVAALGGVVSALAVEVDIRAPANRLADHLIGLRRLAEAEEGVAGVVLDREGLGRRLG